MCLFSDAELNCVKTNMRITSELMQFEIGMSTRRYLPPNGTAGFDRSWVKGNRRLPAPPPRITASRFGLAGMFAAAEDIGKARVDSRLLRSQVEYGAESQSISQQGLCLKSLRVEVVSASHS